MPQQGDAPLDPAKAVSINEQFQQSRQFWSSLVEKGVLDAPSTFINATPHMTFCARREAGCRVPQEPLRGLQQPMSRFESSRSGRQRAPVSIAAGSLLTRVSRLAVRRDPRPRRHRRRLRRPHQPALRPPDRLRRHVAHEPRGAQPEEAEGRHLAGQVPQPHRAHPERGQGAFRVRRGRRLGAQAAAELRHPRDQGLRSLPHRRTVPQDHEPDRRRSAQGEGVTRRRPSVLRPCRFRTSTPAWSTARPRSCSGRSRPSAPSS